MLPYIFVFSLLILVIVILLYSKQEKKISSLDKEPIFTGKPCPICHWPLQHKERVHSHLYKNGEDSIMHIYGCPYCFRDHPKSKYDSNSIRTCPACKKKLKEGEYIIARLFEKPGKNHVHVLGCYRCRGKR